MFKNDNFAIGVIIGSVIAVLIALGISVVQTQFIDNVPFEIINSKQALMFSLIPNVILFRVLMVNLKKIKMGRGLLLVTLIFIFLILIKP